MSDHHALNRRDDTVHAESNRRGASGEQAPTSASRTTSGVVSPERESHDQLGTWPCRGQQFPLTDALAEELAGHLPAGKKPALREQIARWL